MPPSAASLAAPFSPPKGQSQASAEVPDSMEQQASADVPGSALPPAEGMPPRWRTEEEELQLALNISMMEEPDMPLAGEALTSALAPVPSQVAVGVDSRTSPFLNVGASCYINSILQAVY